METRYTSNITKSTQEFNRLKEQSADFDLFELTDARLALRPSMEEAAQERIRKEAPDGKISIRGFWTDKLLREDGMVAWHKEQERHREVQQERKRGLGPQHKPKAREKER